LAGAIIASASPDLIASCIANEDYAEQLFDVSASDAVRATSLRALGWPDGRLPGKKVLLEHMLKRVEYEYADHLCSHSYEPGEWCEECQCSCARIDTADDDDGGGDDGSSSTDDDDDNAHACVGDDSLETVEDWGYLFDDDDDDNDDDHEDDGDDDEVDADRRHDAATAA